MKKITKSLMTLLLLCASIGVNAVTYNVTLGNELTSVKALTGKMFAIVNKADGKVIFNAGNDYNLSYDTQENAFKSTKFLFSVDSLTTNEKDSVRDKFLIRCYDIDRTHYRVYGNLAYFQSNTPDKTTHCCFFFALGDNNQLGVDAHNTAVWDIKYDATNEAFTLRNVGTGNYYCDPTKEANSQEPGYFKFYEVNIEKIVTPGEAVQREQQADGSYLVTGLLDSKAYTNLGAWGGVWSGNGLEKEQDWTAFDYVWIKYRGFSGAINFGVMYSEFKSHEGWGDSYYDATVGVSDTAGVIGVALDKTSKYVKGNADEDGKYKGDVYAKHIREIFIQATSGGSNITIEGIYVGSKEQYLAAKEANDPTEWTEIYSNDGKNANTVLKKYFKYYLAAETNNDAIEVKSLEPGKTYTEYNNAELTNDWDTQFFIALPKVLNSSNRFKIKMKVKASKAAGSQMQGHNTLPVPGTVEDGVFKGTYIGNLSMEAVNFTTDWEDYVATGTALNNMSLICLNLEVKREEITYSFDDIHVYVESKDVEGLANSIQINPLSVTDAGFATFVPVKDVIIPEGVTAYTATLDEGKVALNKVTDTKLHAGDPFVIEAAQGCVNFEVTTGAPVIENNDLSYSDGTVVSSDNSYYVLATGTHGPGFYLLDNDVTIPAGKAYLMVEAGGREFIGFADEATAIKTIETAKAKGAIFNLAGQQVKKAQKGVYIIDGKKAIVK